MPPLAKCPLTARSEVLMVQVTKVPGDSRPTPSGPSRSIMSAPIDGQGVETSPLAPPENGTYFVPHNRGHLDVDGHPGSPGA